MAVNRLNSFSQGKNANRKRFVKKKSRPGGLVRVSTPGAPVGNLIHRPVARAPKNTSQYIIESHASDENEFGPLRGAVSPLLNTTCSSTDSNASLDLSSPIDYQLPDDEEYFRLNFEADYYSLIGEELLSLPREALVQRYIDLRQRIEDANFSQRRHVDQLSDQIDRLKKENQSLMVITDTADS